MTRRFIVIGEALARVANRLHTAADFYPLQLRCLVCRGYGQPAIRWVQRVAGKHMLDVGEHELLVLLFVV